MSMHLASTPHSDDPALAGQRALHAAALAVLEHLRLPAARAALAAYEADVLSHILARVPETGRGETPAAPVPACALETTLTTYLEEVRRQARHLADRFAESLYERALRTAARKAP